MVFVSCLRLLPSIVPFWGVLLYPSNTTWWFQPIWKIFVKLDHFPKFRVENKKCLKPPPRIRSDSNGCHGSLSGASELQRPRGDLRTPILRGKHDVSRLVPSCASGTHKAKHLGSSKPLKKFVHFHQLEGLLKPGSHPVAFQKRYVFLCFPTIFWMDGCLVIASQPFSVRLERFGKSSNWKRQAFEFLDVSENLGASSGPICWNDDPENL